jgi:hypothetical protein
MKHFYLYYSYEEYGRGYIGKRECWCLPEKDIKYFGSFSDKTFRPTKKIILEEFDSVEGALEAECVLHNFYEVDKNPHFANKARQTSKKFYYVSPLGSISGDKNPSKRPEVKEKIAKGNRGKIRTAEHRKKMSEYRKGRLKNEEHKKKIKLSNCRYIYTLISPQGQITETIFYTDFCKEHNLNFRKINEVARGIRLHHKKWKALRYPISKGDK